MRNDVHLPVIVRFAARLDIMSPTKITAISDDGAESAPAMCCDKKLLLFVPPILLHVSFLHQSLRRAMNL